MRLGPAGSGGGWGLKNLSNWRSVRLCESRVEQQLRRRYVLWLHGLWIGLIVLLMMWAASHVQMLLGNQSLALRYFITLGVGYLSYLLGRAAGGGGGAGFFICFGAHGCPGRA